MDILAYIENLFRKKPKIIVVLGQTSTGKSDLAVEIAKLYNGEIISADSRQVYRGMDLGSGKITTAEMQGVPHHLLDVVNPKDLFSAEDFKNLGRKAIQKILEKNKNPIICGGTGFYIDSLIYDTEFSSVSPNPELRKKLSVLDTKTLAEKFTTEYPLEAKKIDLKNKVRVVRAFEICKAIGSIPKTKQHKKYKTLFIGLELEKEKLAERIHQRIINRIEQGMIDEVKNLYAGGVSYERLESFGLEYRHISRYLLGKTTEEEMIENLYRDTLKFAKRQKTWFKRNKDIHWFNSLREKDLVMNKINDFLKK